DSLTFEDAAIARLRRKKGPRQAFRDQVTRAEFVARLAKEADVPFVSPWQHFARPVSTKSEARAAGRTKDENRAPGFGPGAAIRVKNVKADQTQTRLAETILDTCMAAKVSFRHMAMTICCATTESNMVDLTHGDSYHPDSAGPFGQWLVPYPGAGDVVKATRYFLFGIPEKKGIVEQDDGGDPGAQIQAVQASAYPDAYAEWWKESVETVRTYLGGSGTATTTVTSEVRYAFQVKKDESYWDAIKRLAKEVGWRAFVSNGKLYFMTDSQLLRSRPRLRIKSDHAKRGTKNYTPGIDSVSFDLAANKATDSAVIAGRRAATWQAPPGTVVILENFGHANGRWLVSDIETDLTNEDFVAKLKRPAKPLPEPAPETKTRTVSVDGPVGEGAERAVAWAKKVVGTGQGSAKYNYWMSKVGGYDPWCSFWIGFLMREICGLECSGFDHSSYWLTWSGGKRVSTSKIKPGDIVVYEWGDGGDTDHVALYIGDGQRIGGNEGNSVVAQNPADLGHAVGVVRPNYK
ncbi:MAG TPA: NlpC/P60 family protein, partial [Solirubrobacterales bacterium]|nr:NlpC/P60 family protein [Solirubrobacterales bacterium]